MVTKKDLIIAVLSTFCLTAALLVVLPTNSSSPYDPWADINDDGKIDMRDISYDAKLFGTLGDPTKCVNVTNWPTCCATTIWYRTPLNNTLISSATYNTYGFGHLHVLVHIACLSQDANATVILYSNIWNENHTNHLGMSAWTVQFVGSSTMRNSVTTIPVPSEEFYFYAYTTSVVSNAQIYLSFYLTWS
jgi:hypothetical protein